MRKLLIVCELFFSISLFAQDAQSLFSKATTAYEKNDFPTAITSYKTLLKDYPYNVDIHYNLANAYQKQQDTVWAVYHYEQVLKVQPDFKAARVNLQFLRPIESSDRHFQMETSEVFYSLFSMFSIGTWSMIALLFSVLTLVGFAVKLYVANNTKIGNYAFWIALPLALFSYGIVKFQQNYLTTPHYVLTLKSASLKNEQREFSREIMTLPQATKCRLLSKENNWYQVQLVDETVGWVEKNLVIGL